MWKFSEFLKPGRCVRQFHIADVVPMDILFPGLSTPFKSLRTDSSPRNLNSILRLVFLAGIYLFMYFILQFLMSSTEIGIVDRHAPLAEYRSDARTVMGRARRAEAASKAMESIVASVIEEAKQDVVRHDHEALAAKVRALEAQQLSDSANVESLQHSLERLHVVLNEYRQERDTLSEKLVSIFRAAQTSDATLTSIDEFMEKLSSGQLQSNASSRELEEELADQISKCAELETKLVQWSEWAETMQSELEARHAENTELEEQRIEMQGELETLTLGSSTLRKENTDLSESVSQLTFDLEQQALDNQLLSQEVSELRARVVDIDATRRALSNLQATHKEDLEKLCELTKAESEIRASVSHLSDQLEALQRELTATQTSLETATADNTVLASGNKRFANELERISTNITDMGFQNMEEVLRFVSDAKQLLEDHQCQEFSELSSRVASVDPAQLEQELARSAEMEASLAQWNEWSVAVTAELEQRRVEHDGWDLERSRLEKEIERVKAEEKRQAASVEDLRAQLENKGGVDEKIQILEIDLDNVTGKLHETEMALRKTSTEKNDLEDQLRQIKHSNETSGAELEAARNELKHVSQEMAQREQALTQQVTLCNEQDAKLSDWNVWSESVIAMMEEKDRTIQQLEEAQNLVGLGSETDRLAAELAVRNATIKALTKRVEELEISRI
jgi:chromosome segregation ATPase